MLLQGGSPISTASWLRNGSHSNDYSSQTLASFGLRPSGSLTGQLPGASQVLPPASLLPRSTCWSMHWQCVGDVTQRCSERAQKPLSSSPACSPMGAVLDPALL